MRSREFELIRVERKLLRRRKGVQKSRKSFILTIPWILAKLATRYPGFIVHLRLTVPRRMVLRKERCAEKRKELLLYCYIPAWMKNGGLIPWSAAVVCGMSKTSWKMEAHRIKGDLENHLTPGYSVWSNG